MPRLDPIYNINNRILLHVLFWLGYYWYRVLNYGGYVNTYENVIYVQLLELPVKMVAVYLNLYVFMPRFLLKNKAVIYAMLVVVTLFVGTMIQLNIIRWCMDIGIYSATPWGEVFSVRKYMSAQWHFITIMSMTAGIKILKDAYRAQQVNQSLAKDKLENELKFLKSQINPHFLFNTLNSLYALTLEKSDLAPEMLLKLSDLMHYMLYDTGQNQVELGKEVEYLSNYIELEKFRYGDELNVYFQVNGAVDNIRIAPMLLIPLVENSFKHGPGKIAAGGYIKIELSSQQGVIQLRVENSTQDAQPPKDTDKGIGLTNLQRRLDLLYMDRYSLHLESREHSYLALLTIRLKP